MLGHLAYILEGVKSPSSLKSWRMCLRTHNKAEVESFFTAYYQLKFCGRI